MGTMGEVNMSGPPASFFEGDSGLLRQACHIDLTNLGGQSVVLCQPSDKSGIMPRCPAPEAVVQVADNEVLISGLQQQMQ